MSGLRCVTNIDFPAVSRVHLDERYHQIDGRCQRQQKRAVDGGWLEMSQDEAAEYLSGRRQLMFNGKAVTNLTHCILCFPNGFPS